MPRLKANALPSYRLHKQSGQAIVTLSGKDHLLGPHGTKASKLEYDRVVGEWQQNGRQLPREKTDVTVKEVTAAFWQHAEKYYRRPDGRPSKELKNFRDALKPLIRLYATTPAVDFGPLSLAALMQEMVKLGWARTNINRQIGRVKQVFRWAGTSEKIPSGIYHALAAVPGLKAGRSDARESEPVKPVAEEFVYAVLPHLSRQVATMVKLQLLCGGRPSEICQMRGCDIDTTGKVWLYRPASHKTAYRGHQRTIYIGPNGQELIRPFLKRDLRAYLFRPADAEAERHAARSAARVTPMSCGNGPGDNRKDKPKRKAGECYLVESYSHAIKYACAVAFPPPAPLAKADDETAAAWKARLTAEQKKKLADWRKAHYFHPHQLRHTAGTRIRKEFGLEAAKVLLGHRTITMSQHYAQQDIDAAVRIVGEVG